MGWEMIEVKKIEALARRSGFNPDLGGLAEVLALGALKLQKQAEKSLLAGDTLEHFAGLLAAAALAAHRLEQAVAKKADRP